MGYDHALGPVDDEGSVIRHQGNFTKEHFLFLDIPDGLIACFRILIKNGETDCDLQRSGVRHPALLALGHVVLKLQTYGVAATVAERHNVLVKRSAAMAQYIAQMERIGLDGRAASGVAAGRAEVVQTLKVAALALPVADRVVYELKLTEASEIRNRENALENALQASVIAFAGQ